MDGLLGHPERFGDVLPRPAPGARVVDVQRLKALEKPAQRRDRSKALTWVAAPDLLGQVNRSAHGVSIS